MNVIKLMCVAGRNTHMSFIYILLVGCLRCYIKRWWGGGSGVERGGGRGGGGASAPGVQDFDKGGAHLKNFLAGFRGRGRGRPVGGGASGGSRGGGV